MAGTVTESWNVRRETCRACHGTGSVMFDSRLRLMVMCDCCGGEGEIVTIKNPPKLVNPATINWTMLTTWKPLG